MCSLYEHHLIIPIELILGDLIKTGTNSVPTHAFARIHRSYISLQLVQHGTVCTQCTSSHDNYQIVHVEMIPDA